MKQQHRTVIKEYVLVLIGATLVALSYNVFLLPSKLAAGGISGISTVLYELFGFSPAMTQFVINIPIFIIGWLVLGKDFGGKTLLGTFWVPFIIGLTANTPITITNPVLGAIYGGIVLGIGLGIVYIGKGSTGGTASIAQILKKFTGKSSGYTQLIVDGVVVLSSIFVFSLELTLFALMAIYISSKTIDFVQLRTSATKLIVIITEEEEKVQELIRTGIDRGLTKVRSVGGYSNMDKTLILCVAEQQEAVKLKGMLQQEIPTSFVIFLNASEILGRGFSIDKYYGQKL
ncbi:YitT family protein [Ornithinibacillus sp. BX22]|uniref:YitT family protein n=2 Tax=Ornithinibacillus TaxID=484508 RepID=A0A923L5Q1_9BACI|nr:MULTISPECIES: YitT family protein [Ornithinibacillus]MBC5636865.1 YitT family protein [Ornithinibacillus hominis]MBS3681431.1 YitT family protein [Ornithinibacillus massiliensis]